MKQNKYLYLSVTPKHAFGIRKKINGFSSAISNIGFSCKAIIEESTIGLLKQLPKHKENYDLIFVRHYSPKVIFIIIFLTVSFKSRVVLDLPTPLKIGVNEEKNFFKKIILFCIYFIMTPFINLLCFKILMYGPESKYFLPFTKNKILDVTNGYNTSLISFEKTTLAESSTLKLIGVAAIADWHGFDRIINSIKNSKSKVEFLIIGDGPELRNLIKQVKSLGLNGRVKFLGKLQGKELEKIYLESNIGISTCGGFRKNIQKACDLKSREYANYGLPFISSVADDDFTDCDFVYRVPNDDSCINIDQIISDYNNRKLNHQRDRINKYAIDKLSFNIKVKEILDLCC